MTTIGDIVTGAAQRYGQDPQTLLREAQIESGLNPAAHNASGADGMFQFMPGTARQYGLANTQDPVASADAAARLLRDNRSYLTKVLGRDPTGGELYLAHQQGAGGAANLLSNPDAPAATIVGTRAVLANGGTQGMTARQFADLWASKFSGASPAGSKLGQMYSGAIPATPGQTPLPLNAAPGLDPAATLAASLPSLEDGTPAMPQLAPTVANGGASSPSSANRSRALITGQGGLGALFS